MSGFILKLPPKGGFSIHEFVPRGRPSYQTISTILGSRTYEPIQIRWNGKLYEAWVDEEGLLKQLPQNHALQMCLARRFENYPGTIVGIGAVWRTLMGVGAIWIPYGKGKRDDVLRRTGLDFDNIQPLENVK